MLESGAEAEADIAAIEQRLKDNKTEEVRVAVASGGLREKLQRFEGDLHEIASRNVALRSEVDAMPATLARKSVVWGRSVSVRLAIGGGRIIKKKKQKKT